MFLSNSLPNSKSLLWAQAYVLESSRPASHTSTLLLVKYLGARPSKTNSFWRNFETVGFGDSWVLLDRYLGVSKNRRFPKSSILIGFSIINHPFWGTIIFGNPHFWAMTCVSRTSVNQSARAPRLMMPRIFQDYGNKKMRRLVQKGRHQERVLQAQGERSYTWWIRDFRSEEWQLQSSTKLS